MTGLPETGRESPADELVDSLRSDAAAISRLRRKTPKDYEDAVRYAAAADLIEAQAARIASLEAERARTVEADRANRRQHEHNIRVSEARRSVEFLHEFAREMNDPHAKAVLNLAADHWARARSRALAVSQSTEGVTP